MSVAVFSKAYFTKAGCGLEWSLLPSPALDQRSSNYFITRQNYTDNSSPEDKVLFYLHFF